jgi:hypothetical protein
MEYTNGKMVIHLKVIINEDSKMELELGINLMVQKYKDNGQMIPSMEL